MSCPDFLSRGLVTLGFRAEVGALGARLVSVPVVVTEGGDVCKLVNADFFVG